MKKLAVFFCCAISTLLFSAPSINIETDMLSELAHRANTLIKALEPMPSGDEKDDLMEQLKQSKDTIAREYHEIHMRNNQQDKLNFITTLVAVKYKYTGDLSSYTFETPLPQDEEEYASDSTNEQEQTQSFLQTMHRENASEPKCFGCRLL